MFHSNIFELFSFLFFGTAASEEFPKKEKDGGENENEKGDDIQEKIFVPGQLHCGTFHPGVMRVSKQVFKPPHGPEPQKVKGE